MSHNKPNADAGKETVADRYARRAAEIAGNIDAANGTVVALEDGAQGAPVVILEDGAQDGAQGAQGDAPVVAPVVALEDWTNAKLDTNPMSFGVRAAIITQGADGKWTRAAMFYPTARGDNFHIGVMRAIRETFGDNAEIVDVSSSFDPDRPDRFDWIVATNPTVPNVRIHFALYRSGSRCPVCCRLRGDAPDWCNDPFHQIVMKKSAKPRPAITSSKSPLAGLVKRK